ncbi:hypothetical protein DBR06_SOUSAS3510004, partial [Sousa chinensis]
PHQEEAAQTQNAPTCHLLPSASRTQRSELLLPFTPESRPSSRHHSQASVWRPASRPGAALHSPDPTPGRILLS